MKEKYYRNRIGITVILFTFIPVMIFAGLFYRQVYAKRVECHLAENEMRMQTKVDTLKNEIIRQSNLIVKLSETLSFSDESYSKLDNLEKKYINFQSIAVEDEAGYYEIFRQELNSNRVHRVGYPFYHVDNNGMLFIAYPIDGLKEEQKYLVGQIDTIDTVNWFTNIAPDIHVSVFANGVSLYETNMIKGMDENVYDMISETPDTIKLSGDHRTYIAFKELLPEYKAEIYVFREDRTIELYRALQREYLAKVFFMILISALVTYFVSLKLNHPFVNIKLVAKQIIDGDYDAKIENVEDELLSLNLSFNKIANTHKEKNEEFVQYAMTMLEKNENLTLLNKELESSYDQLKAITEMLEYSKEKYQALFDHIKEFIWVFDQEGTITYANAVMCEKLGYTADELIGRHFLDVFIRFDEDAIATEDELIDQLLRRDYSNLSIWMSTQSGEELLVSANSKRTFKNGILQGAQGTARTVDFEEMLQNRILRKNREFEIVKEITWSLANSRTLESLLKTVVQKVELLFKPEICTIRIVEGDQLIYKMGMGEYAHYARTSDFAINDDFSGIAVKENRVLRVHDFDNTNFYDRAAMSAILEEVDEIIVIPLENKGVIHGTINIGLAESLTDVEVKIAKALANQASIGIEKMKLYDQLKEDYMNTIRVLASAVEAKDKYTEGHSYRVSLLAKRIGEELNMDVLELEELEIAGMLHDIGKIGIDDEILTKKGALSTAEYTVMKSHPTIGKRILEPIGLSDNIIQGIYMHHKRYDLSGYPEEEGIERLGIYPSVIGVADALDAITSKRTYSDEKSLQYALDEIKKYKGSQFAPEVVEALELIVNQDELSLISIIN